MKHTRVKNLACACPEGQLQASEEYKNTLAITRMARDTMATGKAGKDFEASPVEAEHDKKPA